jgi:two-component system, OmpR family, response regulator PhoP
MRCLIAEDEPQLREQLAHVLRTAGYTVDAVDNGPEALFQIQEFQYAVAVLDLGLPGFGGLDVIKQCRQQGSKTPIVVLTARTRVQQVVEALEAGADDYLKKPIDPDELLAHIAAVLRRYGSPERLAQVEWYFSGFTLDTKGRRLLRDGEVVVLTASEYAILELLWSKDGAVVSKREIAHSYQRDPDIEMSANSVEALIGRLKRKSGTDVSQVGLPIVTVRGEGYRFEGGEV